MIRTTTKLLLVLIVSFQVVACANPLNFATSNRYSDACTEAERNGRLDVAEQMCYRALVNVDWGNLGPELKSDKLYNLAKIKRKLEKYDEAISLFQQSLEIEETLSGKTSAKTGRRIAELALIYAEQKRYENGIPLVQRLSSIAEQYGGSERVTVGFIHYHYSEWLRKNNQVALADSFAQKAANLGFKSTP